MQVIIISRGSGNASTQCFRDRLKKLDGEWTGTAWRIPAGETKLIRKEQLKLAADLEAAGLVVALETE